MVDLWVDAEQLADYFEKYFGNYFGGNNFVFENSGFVAEKIIKDLEVAELIVLLPDYKIFDKTQFYAGISTKPINCWVDLNHNLKHNGNKNCRNFKYNHRLIF